MESDTTDQVDERGSDERPRLLSDIHPVFVVVQRDAALADDKLRSIEQAALKCAPLVAGGELERPTCVDALLDIARNHGLCGNERKREEVEHVIGMGLSGTAALVDARARDDVERSPLIAPSDRGNQSPIKATPFVWRDPSAIPTRDWLYGHLLIRKFVTATVAPGGVGKSSLVTAETLAQVTGKPLLGIRPVRPLRVWLWSLEDPQEETERKLQAAALHYGIRPEDVGDRLFVNSGRDTPLVMAEMNQKSGAMVVRPVIGALVDEIKRRSVDVVVIDPFVSCHRVPENDNGAQDMVLKEWGRVSELGNCAPHVIDHTRKMGADSEVTTESSRGGKAKTDACRVVRVVNRMTKEEGDRAGIENHRLYFRTYNDKANLQPPAEESDWFKLNSVHLGNGPLGGDSVGVVAPWKWPDALAGITGTDFEKATTLIRAGRWRENVQAADWVGKPIAEALGLDLANKADKAKVKAVLKSWMAASSLAVVDGLDDDRKSRKFVEVAE